MQKRKLNQEVSAMCGLTSDEAWWLCNVLNALPQSALETWSPVNAIVRKAIEEAIQPHSSDIEWRAVRNRVLRVCEGLDDSQTRELVAAVERVWDLTRIPTDDDMRSVGLVD